MSERLVNSKEEHSRRNITKYDVLLLGPFHGATAVPSVTRCRCYCGHRCAGGVRQWRCATVATPGEWQCKKGGVWRLAVANGPNISQMLLVVTNVYFCIDLSHIMHFICIVLSILTFIYCTVVF